MDKKLKAKWVKALMSGEYKQGKEYLHRYDKFCCLGVLRHINDPNDTDCSDDLEYLVDDGLSQSQCRKFGITYNVQRGLAELNDSGVPFPVIAGFIQENL